VFRLPVTSRPVARPPVPAVDPGGHRVVCGDLDMTTVDEVRSRPRGGRAGQRDRRPAAVRQLSSAGVRLLAEAAIVHRSCR
jgi:hypothetical protein